MRIRVFGQYVHVSIAALALLDAILLCASVPGAALLRFGGDLAAIEPYLDRIWATAALFSVVILVSLLGLGIYSSRQRARSIGLVLRLGFAVVAGTAFTAVVFYFVPDAWVGRGTLVLSALLGFAGLAASRLTFGRLIDESLFKRRIIIYGSGHRALSVAALRRRSDRRGFHVEGFVQPSGEGRDIAADRILDASQGLMRLIERHDADEVVVAMEDRRRAFPLRDLLECRMAGIEVTELLTFLERETGRVRIDMLNPSWMIFSDGFRRDPLRLFSSRALDVAASSLILATTWPLMLLTVLAIKLESGWTAPVMYKQERVGLGGKTFSLLKFRSMRLDAEGDGHARWAEKNDPRITRVGRVIRRLRIDELPQILNVLRGDMSFVGPRPERPAFVRELSGKVPYYVQRHCVRPGITGWAQLCYQYGSSQQDALEKLQYDLYYIKNNSFLFDVSILVQTAEVIFMGKGAR